MTTLLEDTTQAARKTHRCDSCGRMIEKGQTYHRQRCVDGGDAWTYKTHDHCRKASVYLWSQCIPGLEDDYMINVSDREREDRQTIFAHDPELYRAVWPDLQEYIR